MGGGSSGGQLSSRSLGGKKSALARQEHEKRKRKKSHHDLKKAEATKRTELRNLNYQTYETHPRFLICKVTKLDVMLLED